MEVAEAIRRCKTENSAPIPDLRPLNLNCRVGPDANPRVLAWLMERALKSRTACSRQTPGLTLRFPFRDRGAAPLKLQISYLGCAAFGASGELEVCYRAETVAYRRFSPFGGVAGLFRPVFHGNPGICACGHRARRNGNPRIRACGYRTRRERQPRHPRLRPPRPTERQPPHAATAPDRQPRHLHQRRLPCPTGRQPRHLLLPPPPLVLVAPLRLERPLGTRRYRNCCKRLTQLCKPSSPLTWFMRRRRMWGTNYPCSWV